MKHTMKLTAIPGVKKEVCTAEQKIAYELAWHYKDQIKAAYDKCVLGCDKNNVIRTAVRELTNVFEREHPSHKYNIDAIYCALGSLEGYINGGGKTLWSYREIGEAFPVERI